MDITKNSFSESLAFIYEISNANENTFKETLDNKNYDEKKKLEKIALFIYISKYHKYNKAVNKFYKNYIKYIEQVVKTDSDEYCNNLFCRYLMFEDSENLSKDLNNKKIFGKVLADILEEIDEKTDQILDKLDSGEKISTKEYFFLENSILLGANYLYIDSETALKYAKYFKYRSLYKEDGKFDQLYRLYITTKKLDEICGIEDTFISIRPLEMLPFPAQIQPFEDGSIKIIFSKQSLEYLNGMNDYLLFILIYHSYHEVGHINQLKNKDKYNKELQEVFDMEYFITQNEDSLEFYIKYHNCFYIERDADSFAFREIRRDYKDSESILRECENMEDALRVSEEEIEDYKKRLYEEYNRLKSLDKRNKQVY